MLLTDAEHVIWRLITPLSLLQIVCEESEGKLAMLKAAKHDTFLEAISFKLRKQVIWVELSVFITIFIFLDIVFD